MDVIMRPYIRAMIRRFTTAIVRIPCPEMVHGITTANLGMPDFGRALEQHQQYVEALEQCGLQVKVLKSDIRFPDSTFIEDVALCTSSGAVITNPGAPARSRATDWHPGKVWNERINGSIKNSASSENRCFLA